MKRVAAYRGQRFTIAFARLRNGRSPGAEFFDQLSKTDKAKLDKFRLLADHGRTVNQQKFGELGGRLYEFKSFQVRMPFGYARERGLVLITHGFYKKRDKTPKEEIERARRILGEDQEQAGPEFVTKKKI